MKKLLLSTLLMISFQFVKATELPMLKLEIEKTYHIETTTHIDTSEQWAYRLWDHKKWDFTPISYDEISESYKIKAVLTYYQHVIQRKFEYRGWMEEEVYETGYLGSYRSPIVYMNANLIPIYFNLTKDGTVSNIDFSEFKNYRTPEGHSLEMYKNSQGMVESHLKLIFLKFKPNSYPYNPFKELKGEYDLLEEDENTLTLNCKIPEKFFFFNKIVDSKVIVDKNTGLVLRNHINYLVPQKDYSGTIINEEKCNNAVYYQKYIPEYNSNFKVLNYSPYNASFDTTISRSNFILEGQLNNRIEGNDSIIVSLTAQGVNLKLPLDLDNKFKLELNLKENTRLQFMYPSIYSDRMDGGNIESFLKSMCIINAESGDNINLLLNTDSSLIVDRITGVGASNSKSDFDKYAKEFNSSFISSGKKLSKELKTKLFDKLHESRSAVSPQVYLNNLNQIIYGSINLPAHFDENYPNKILVNNTLAKTSNEYLNFLDNFIDNTLDAKVSLATGVDITGWNSQKENKYYLGQIALAEPVKSYYLSYYLKNTFRNRNWNLNERLYNSFRENYGDKPVFDEVEMNYYKYDAISPGKPSPDFKLTTINGLKISKPDLIKKVSLIFFYNQLTYEMTKHNDDFSTVIDIYNDINEAFPGQLKFILAYSGSISDAKKIQSKLPAEILVCMDNPFPKLGIFTDYLSLSSSLNYIILDRNGNIAFNTPLWFNGILPSIEVEKALAIPYKSKNEIPVWLRIVFILLIGAIISILLTFIFYRRITTRRLQKSELNKKMRELELTAIRAQMNPHFMYNCLNSIQNLVQKKQNDEAHLYLSKFASLIRRTLNTSKKEELSLSDELETINEYIELEKLRFDFEYQLKVDDSIDLVSVFVPPMLLQPFVENALLHGLLPKTNNRILSIRIERKSDKLCISVEDNGVGRHASSLKESSGNGKGLQLSEERLKLLAEKYKTDFQLKIEDLSNMDGLPLGTKVNLCFEEE